MSILEKSSAFSEKFACKKGIESNFESNLFHSVLMVDETEVFFFVFPQAADSLD